MLIDLRQLNRYQDTRPDARIARIFERKEFEDSQKYNQEKHKFKMIHELVDTIVDLLLWVGFWYVAIWDWMNQLMSENGLELRCESVRNAKFQNREVYLHITHLGVIRLKKLVTN